MPLSEIAQSGILLNNEHIIEESVGMYRDKNKIINGFWVITNIRLFFVPKKHLFQKGYDIIWSGYLDKILSVSQKGLLAKHLEINTTDEKGEVFKFAMKIFGGANLDMFKRELINAKGNYKGEPQKIEIVNQPIQTNRYCINCNRTIPFDAIVCPYCDTKQ